MIANQNFTDYNVPAHAVQVGQPCDGFTRKSQFVETFPTQWAVRTPMSSSGMLLVTTIGGAKIAVAGNAWLMTMSGTRMQAQDCGANLVAVQNQQGSVNWERVDSIVPWDGAQDGVRLSNNSWYAAGLDPKKGLILVQ